LEAARQPQAGLAAKEPDLMRIVVVGAGVIDSVYAGRLAAAGHAVTLLARGPRLSDLETHGLVLEDAESGWRSTVPLRVTAQSSPTDRYDLVIVTVRFDQLAGVLPALREIGGEPDILFLGNTLSHQAQLLAASGDRALFGFPAVGGARDGPVVRYVQIEQQTTMLGERDGTSTSRTHRLQTMFGAVGFPVDVSTNIGGWMLAHTAFVVPIGFALYRCGTDPAALAADSSTLRLMAQATREAFTVLDDAEIPANLRWLYLRMPTRFAVHYWRGVLAGPHGELWFAAHSRAAPDEMQALARELMLAVDRSARPTPYLDALLRPR